jgi:hypothetical protein
MPSPLVVTHERLGNWARQLRPRLAVAGPIRWIETRSAADLSRALFGTVAPIGVIDLADRPRAMLLDLDLAARAAPEGLFLVLDPLASPGMAALARELGATLVLSGFNPPNRVADLLLRWLPLARRRSENDGWAPTLEPDPEPWDRDDLLGPAPARFGAAALKERPKA